jgi:membrane-associated protease RseP (regulator of RpoE activity)
LDETVNPSNEATARTTGPTTAEAATPMGTVPPTVNTQRGPGWFSTGWRYIVAAAAIVLVAGAFFTIGWFTSTRGDDDHFFKAGEIGRFMDGRGWGFDRGDGEERPGDAYGRGPGRWEWPSCPQRPFYGQPAPQAPSPPQTPPSQQTPSAQQGYLGIRIASITPALQQRFGITATSGALVISLDQTGPAFQAGLKRGDVITSIDGTAVTAPENVINLVANKRPGDILTVVVDRNGQSLTFQVTLGSWPTTVTG